MRPSNKSIVVEKYEKISSHISKKIDLMKLKLMGQQASSQVVRQHTNATNKEIEDMFGQATSYVLAMGSGGGGVGQPLPDKHSRDHRDPSDYDRSEKRVEHDSYR